MKRIKFLLLTFLLIASAGCIADTSEETPEKRAQPGHIGADANLQFNESGPYTIDGRIIVSYPRSESEVFNDVMICFYDDDGSLISGKNLGDFHAPYDAAQISMSFETKPRYAIVDGPQFRKYPSFNFLTIEWTDEHVRHNLDTPRELFDDLSYHPPTDPGVCGRTSR